MGSLYCDRHLVSRSLRAVTDLNRLSVRTGRSLGIDLAECDAPKPRHFADGIREGIYEERPQAVYPCFRFLAEFTSLSVLLGQTCTSVLSMVDV